MQTCNARVGARLLFGLPPIEADLEGVVRQDEPALLASIGREGEHLLPKRVNVAGDMEVTGREILPVEVKIGAAENVSAGAGAQSGRAIGVVLHCGETASVRRFFQAGWESLPIWNVEWQLPLLRRVAHMAKSGRWGGVTAEETTMSSVLDVAGNCVSSRERLAAELQRVGVQCEWRVPRKKGYYLDTWCGDLNVLVGAHADGISVSLSVAASADPNWEVDADGLAQDFYGGEEEPTATMGAWVAPDRDVRTLREVAQCLREIVVSVQALEAEKAS